MPSELGKRMIMLAAKRGYLGADRKLFFHNIRGTKYAELEREVLSLEKEGYIRIEWLGPSNFTVFITPKGTELTRSYQEDAGEVGAVSKGITEKIDDHITAEQDAPSEDAMPSSISVPAVEEVAEEKAVEMENRQVEKHISHEMEGNVTSGGRGIPPPPDDFAEEIGTGTEEIVKEKAISDEFEHGILAAKRKKVMVKKRNAEYVSSEDLDRELLSVLEHLDEGEASTNPPPQAETAALLEEPPPPEAETESIATTFGIYCFWEANQVCPILKSKEFGMDIDFTPNHCIACQLAKIKNLLKK